MRRVSLLVAALLTVVGCALETVQGSGTAASNARSVTEFDKIEVQGSMDVTVTVGGPPSVSVTTDDNLLPLVETEVSGDTLVIDLEGSTSTNLGVAVEITVGELEAVQLDGSGSIAVSGLDTSRFEVDLGGSGRVQADGVADELVVRLDGSGDALLYELRARDAEIELNGSGDVEVTATDQLEADVGGSGSVTYDGDPASVSYDLDGSGDVRTR